MIIGSVSGIPYATFVAELAPVAGVALLLTMVLIAAMHPREFFAGGRFTPPPAEPVHYHRWLVWKTLAVALAMVALFFAGQPVALVAIVAGAILLFTRRVKPQKVYFEIDWPLLVMFAGLFVVVAGLETVIGPDVIAAVGRLDLASVPVLSAITAVLSNLVSNVPAVLVMKPFLETFADPQRAWLVVAMASTLAGNFAIIGSVANLIVAEGARREGVAIGFWAYFRVGAPLTVLSIAFGAWWLGG
jgi:Na+/H+ antiporter NhaD/arsenite permease-like protein